MFAELIDTWELIASSMQGFSIVLVSFFKTLFTTPLIIFPILWLVGLMAKHRIR